MREINNKVVRHLEAEEMMAVLECVKILEKAFHKKMWAVTINPETKQPDEVWGISFGFDTSFEYKSGVNSK